MGTAQANPKASTAQQKKLTPIQMGCVCLLLIASIGGVLLSIINRNAPHIASIASTPTFHNGDTVTVSGTWACGSSLAALDELTAVIRNDPAKRTRVLNLTHSRLLVSGLHVKILSAGLKATQVQALDSGMECWVLSEDLKLSAPTTVRVAPAIPAGQQTVFANVDLLRKAASPVLPSVAWRDLGEHGGFMGATDDIELHPGTGYSPSTINYCISSRVENRVEEAVIDAFVTSPGVLVLARLKVTAAAIQWFNSVGKPVPAGLAVAIRDGKPFQTTAGGLSVEYVLDPCSGTVKQPNGSRYRCVTMDLAIKPASGAWPPSVCRSSNH
jgi:hypothetical protein